MPRFRLLTCVVACLLAGRWATADQPNIVIILADDLGYGDPGCYNSESKIPTPHIDLLAHQGTRFTDAHSPSSVCTPTRYGLLTGRYGCAHPLKRGVLWPWDPPLIEADRLTLPQMLRDLGYRTACVGKWHLGWDWPISGGGFISDEFRGHTIPPEQRETWGKRIDFQRRIGGGPTTRGFDDYYGDDVPNFPPYGFIEGDRTAGLPSVARPPDMFGHAGPALPGWDLSMVMPTLCAAGSGLHSTAVGRPGGTAVVFVSGIDGPAHADRPVTAFHWQKPGGLVWRLRMRS